MKIQDAQSASIQVEGMVIDATAPKAADHQPLGTRAGIDALTGLANRAAFTERLHQAFGAARRGATPFAVHAIDLDRFRAVNELLGHSIGDLLLREVAERLRNCARETDLAAHLGGDEFAVLQGEAVEAEMLAAKIQRELARPYVLGGNELRLSASIGISSYVPGASVDPDAMLVQADLALFRAKAEGRNRYRLYADEPDQDLRDRVTLGDELRKAIDGDELELHYRPQAALTSTRPAGADALVRWNHPTRGLLNAGAFIPIAEKTGSIVALGHWVLNQACRQMRLWRDRGMAPPVVAINLSPGQLENGGELVRDVARTVATWGLAPSDLQFDVTKAALAQMTWTGSDVLRRLRDLGVRIAIDDAVTSPP